MPDPRLALPRVFVAADGREPLHPPRGSVTGVFLRDLDLATLVFVAETERPLLAVDIDTVAGVNADLAGVRFVTSRLGIGIVATRRPPIAAAIARQGAIALLHVLAFDSTGLGRSLEAHPGEGVGTLISPGPVLMHLSPEDRARLPRPVVTYGLIAGPAYAWRLLEVVDGVIVSPDCAAQMVRDESGQKTVETVAARGDPDAGRTASGPQSNRKHN